MLQLLNLVHGNASIYKYLILTREQNLVLFMDSNHGTVMANLVLPKFGPRTILLQKMVLGPLLAPDQIFKVVTYGSLQNVDPNMYMYDSRTTE